MSDFISQASFEEGLVAPTDLLAHERLAQGLLEKIVALPKNSVVALHGDWGRGKTDVLVRIALALAPPTRSQEFVDKPIWVNPWQYGTPDLLSPVVIALLERIGPNKSSTKQSIRKAAESIIKAGISFGFKAVGLTVPGGKIYEAAAEESKSLLSSLFEAADLEKDAAPDADPVAMMGKRFSELVGQISSDGKRLLILVDDLDRCAPERQVALLESIRFLVSAGANATFVIAIDPALVRQAVQSNYGTDVFDADQYLEKIFTLRIFLPGMSQSDVGKFVQGCLEQKGPGGKDLGAILADWIHLTPDAIARAAQNSFYTPSLRNPRLIGKIMQKLRLIAMAAPFPLTLPSVDEVEDCFGQFLAWMCLAERWPQFRAALQGRYKKSYRYGFDHLYDAYRLQSDGWDRFEGAYNNTREARVEAKEVLHTFGLPPAERAGSLLQYLEVIRTNWGRERLDRFENVDEFLVSIGL